VRDWSEAGIEERSACNKKITDKLAVLFKVGVVCNEGVRQGPIFKKVLALSQISFFIWKKISKEMKVFFF